MQNDLRKINGDDRDQDMGVQERGRGGKTNIGLFGVAQQLLQLRVMCPFLARPSTRVRRRRRGTGISALSRFRRSRGCQPGAMGRIVRSVLRHFA